MSKELIKRILSALILLPVSFFFIITGSNLFIYFILFILFLTLYEWHCLSFNKKYYIYGIVFIFLSFYTVYDLRIHGDYKIFLLIIIVCISTDIGGYFFGKIIKGPKLTKISPNKTYAGMIGSFVLSLLFSIFYIKNLDFFNISKTIDINYKIIYLILFISLISQIGDLIVSFFKRKSKIEDTGIIIPGHGGILDRIDGIIVAVPVGMILWEILLKI